MLRVAKRAVGGEEYYLAVAAGTGTGVEAAGRWAGSAAAALGLSGEVTRDPLTTVLQGRHPEDGASLSPTHHRVRVVAFDLTFCAPKSVSLLAALADDDVARTVRAGHDEAVAAALGYVERRAAAVRGEPGARRVPAPVDGLVGAAFAHQVSRALDPHLHTHMVVANLGAGPDGRWRALDGRGLYAHRAAADALYHAHLRHALRTSLGVAWEAPRAGRADIAGIGLEARRAFSQRAAAIAAELQRSGRAGPRSADVAAAATRPARPVDVGAGSLVAQWRVRAAAVGLTGRALDRVVDRGPRRPTAGVALVPEDAVEQTVRSLLAGERLVARRHAVAALGKGAAEGAPAAAVEAAADRAMDVLERRIGAEQQQWRPGVAEPRMVPARSVADDLLVRRLAARGLVPGGHHVGRGRDDGPDIGFG